MKKQKILSAVFWMSLYIATAYSYWTTSNHHFVGKEKIIDDSAIPFVMALMVFFLSKIISDIPQKINPKNPNTAVLALTVATLLSPFWFFVLGFAWLVIRFLKDLVLFSKTAKWSL